VAGTFETARVDAFLSLLRKGDIVWDIGAHKGYVALAAARVVGGGGHVYAIEPAADNLTYLHRHITWNKVPNVEIVPVAVSSSDGARRFGGSGSSITFRLDRGDETVDTKTLQSLLDAGLSRPDVLKIDVEGAESDVLRGAGAALHDAVIAAIAIHSREQYEACTALLAARSFTIYESTRMRTMMQRLPDGWSADPDLLAIGPSRRDTDGETWSQR
jgi:FkbM family methyltransferase